MQADDGSPVRLLQESSLRLPLDRGTGTRRRPARGEEPVTHPFQPCPLDESTPGHNFTCALLCTVCGLPAEKHVCEHGNPPPWYNCEGCRAESKYSFRGNF